MKDLLLSPFGKNSLSQGKWLPDSVINVAQTLLKQQFPHVGGLQEVILADTLAFEIHGGEFVQILNVRKSHWIRVSGCFCQLTFYDSMPNCDIPRRTKEQKQPFFLGRKVIFRLQFQHFRLQFQAVQEQHGGSDGGLFTVAFAVVHHYAWGMTPH